MPSPHLLSLRSRIAILYLLMAIPLLPTTYLLYKTYSEGASAQLNVARNLTIAAGDEIRQKFETGTLHHSYEKSGQAQFQDAILEIILDRYNGVEGGFWNTQREFEGYAFPTYDGAAPKRDVPRSEMGSLRELAVKALEAGACQQGIRQGRREAVFTYACPMQGVSPASAVWVMMRVPTSPGFEFDRLKWVVIALLLIIGATGLMSALLLYRWTQDLKSLQSSIQQYSPRDLRELPASREPDLQSIVQSFNDLNHRLRDARQQSDELARKLNQADRLALLGKMAAGIAHEIRNPMATIRIRLENVEVDPATRFSKVLPIVTDQLSRVDRLVQMLLAISQPFNLQLETVNLRDWLQHHLTSIRENAEAKQLRLEITDDAGEWKFDAFHLGRALENLLHNAVSFSPPNGRIDVTSSRVGSHLRIEVRDQGEGLTPEAREHLFLPFHSRREGGTGLGLVLAKEIVEAHGGTLRETGDGSGARFQMEIPWPRS